MNRRRDRISFRTCPAIANCRLSSRGFCLPTPSSRSAHSRSWFAGSAAMSWMLVSAIVTARVSGFNLRPDVLRRAFPIPPFEIADYAFKARAELANVAFPIGVIHGDPILAGAIQQNILILLAQFSPRCIETYLVG